MTDEELLEMVAIIDFFSGTNVMSSGLKLEFEASRPKKAEGS
jgi:alkylhydroperoxidase family enzyme